MLPVAAAMYGRAWQMGLKSYRRRQPMLIKGEISEHLYHSVPLASVAHLGLVQNFAGDILDRG